MIPPNLTMEAARRVFWPRTVLIGSLRFYKEMLRLYEQFGKEEIDALTPWPFFRDSDDPTKYDKVWLSGRRICEEAGVETHLLRIQASDMAYVVNPDGYIGLNSATDIGYAAGCRIPVYAMRQINDTGVNKVINGIKTPEEIILIGKEIRESKYRALEQQFTHEHLDRPK